MKVVSTEALTKLIQLVKSAFIKVDDVVEVTEIETETPSEVTLATVATTGSYSDLLNKPTIPTVNNPTITFTQGGTTKGTITLNQSGDQTIALDAGGGGSSYTAGTGINISSDVISVTSPTLTNTATGSNSITILGTATSYGNGINIGYGSQSFTNCVAIGANAKATANPAVAIGELSEATGMFSIALGEMAKAKATGATQIGYGTNNEENSVYMATGYSNNWKMLGSDGKIPSGRLPIATSVSSSSTNSETVGAKLFYDTCGDIETLINAL